MFLAALRVTLRLGESLGPRARRKRLGAIAERLHKHFNIAVAEVDRGERSADVVLAVATVAGSRREARDRLARVIDALAAHPRADLIGHELIEV